MINVDDLLKPVAEDKPCGEDFSYHPSFQNLETLALGKPETQFSAAEPPEWKEVRDTAIEVLGQSKHLMAGVHLTVALVKLGGAEGLRDGLALMRGLTEKYWGDVYPHLDPEDNNDPTERLNILGNLSSQKFGAHIGQLYVCESPSLGRFSLQQYLTARDASAKPADGAAPVKVDPDFNQIKAAFQDAGPEAAKAKLGFVSEALNHAKGIETFLDSTLGAGAGVNFDLLDKLLTEMKHILEPYAAGGATGEGEPAGEGEVPTEGGGAGGAGGGSGAAARGGPGMSGTIRNRADVVKALDMICNYYQNNEPSSPVPLIIRRAQRLVDKDFMTIVNDLTPDALQQLQVITGKKPEE